MVKWTICRLAKSHVRDQFHCGHPMLDDWLRLRTGQFDRRDLSRTFVATRPGEIKVCGYYAISKHRVLYNVLPSGEEAGLPQIDIPVVLLGRLAVDQSVQGQGLGALLLVDALRRSLQISEHVGVRAVEVDAVDDVAKNFYLKFGFRSLLDDPRHMFLSMSVIRQLNLDRL